MNENVAIRLENVSKDFGKDRVLKSVTRDFERGKIHGVVGNNGSGKTVMFKCICGFLQPTEGKIWVDDKRIGVDVDFPPDIGIIIETPGFLPQYTGVKNLEILASLKKKISVEQIADTIRRVGLDPTMKKPVGKYSLGMRQRLGIAQAKGELLLTIMSSLAQEESRSISENVTWGHRKRFSDGKFSLAYSHFLGYDKDTDGTLKVNEEQAETVRFIYREFLTGKTPQAIANELEKMQIPTPSGGSRWNASTIRNILTNEKYKGDALLQKKFTVDFLQKKMKQNEGEVQQYYIENSHEAIIPPEDWDLVQSEIEKRKSIGSRYSSTSIFASKLICGDCGSFYGHKTWHSTDKYRKTIWRCNAKFDNNHRCQTPTLTEDTIKFAFLKAYNKLINDRETIIKNCELLLSQINMDEYTDEMQRLRDELALIFEQAKICIAENANTAQSQADYERKYSAITRKYEQTEHKLQRLIHETEQRSVRKTKLIAFISELGERGFVLKEWSEEAWIAVVESVTVTKDNKLIFTFKNGSETAVSI